MRVWFFGIVAFLAACSSQPIETVSGDSGKTYSYVDAQGNLVTGRMANQPADKKASAKESQPEENYLTPEEFEAQQEARDSDRFVTYYNAQGELVREHINPVAAKEHQQELVKQQSYKEIEAKAAQMAIERQYHESSTAIREDCCLDILKYADTIKKGKKDAFRYQAGEYGWIMLDQTRPARVYNLSENERRLVLQSYKENGHYLHPYLLLLDEQGVPMMAVNNIFQRRYPETWFRYSYVEGSVTLPDEAAYLVIYLPYVTGSRKEGMSLTGEQPDQPESDAAVSTKGELVVSFMAAD